jgi:hypothetical protein
MQSNTASKGSNPEKVEELRRYASITEIMEHNAEIGRYFFSPHAMRFFNSRVLGGVYGGRIFVTSEKDDSPNGAWDGVRRYTVHECRNGEVFPLSEFGEFLNASTARRAAQKAAIDLD